MLKDEAVFPGKVYVRFVRVSGPRIWLCSFMDSIKKIHLKQDPLLYFVGSNHRMV